MKHKKAIECLSALAQETRLAAFRLIVKAEPLGLRSGEIADRLKVNQATLSRHLAQLERAGLLNCKRVEREARYTVNWKHTDSLLGFLVEDCCQLPADRELASR